MRAKERDDLRALATRWENEAQRHREWNAEGPSRAKATLRSGSTMRSKRTPSIGASSTY